VAGVANCMEHTLASIHSSARALFSAGYIRDDNLDYEAMEEVLEVERLNGVGSWRKHCPMIKPGFNIECAGGNKARFGYCAKEASAYCSHDDNQDTDAVIGIGLVGEGSTAGIGTGWTAKFAGGTQRSRDMWLYVRRAACTGAYNPGIPPIPAKGTRCTSPCQYTTPPAGPELTWCWTQPAGTPNRGWGAPCAPCFKTMSQTPVTVSRRNPGTYPVTYTCTNSLGESLTKIRRLQVSDTLSLTGANPQVVEVTAPSWMRVRKNCR
jgi:hypothetical protein